MKKREIDTDKRSLVNWKMIRIPRIAIQLLSILLLFIAFMVSIYLFQDRIPFLAKMGNIIGIRSGSVQQDEAMDNDTVETHFARLVFVKGDVTVKPNKELRFVKAEKNQTLREGDSIRTYSGGYAEVLFDEGNRLSIKPDSLVMIREMKENRLTKIRRSSIKLRESDIEAFVRRPKVAGSEFRIETPTATAKITEAKVALQVSKDNESTLKVYKGAVNLEIGEESLEVTQNQGVAITKESKIEDMKDLPPSPELLSPENLAEFFFKNLNQMQAVLKWKPASDNVKYRLQAALDPYFSDLVIVRTGLARQGVVVQSLKSGIYYWRVSAITPEGTEGDFSDYRVFKVTIDQKPPDVYLDDILLLKVSGKVNAQITGQTEADATVSIDGVTVHPDKTGRFKYILSNVNSDAEITVVAEDQVGNKNILKKKIQTQ